MDDHKLVRHLGVRALTLKHRETCKIAEWVESFKTWWYGITVIILACHANDGGSNPSLFTIRSHRQAVKPPDFLSGTMGSNPIESTKWAVSSDGRTPALQAGCHRFDSGTVHHNNNKATSEVNIMKQKIRIVDNISKKVVEKEINIPNKMYLDTQIRYRANVYRDKTKYTRKQKHRNRNDYEHTPD